MSAADLPVTWEAYAKKFGLELHRRRVAIGLSQEELAHRAGVTRNYYQQLERGRLGGGAPANPSLKVVLRLAHSLAADVTELLPDASAVEWI